METDTLAVEEIFDIRSANEWIGAAKKRPVPKMLFGDLWLEGELAILFADTGKGKSLLAAQIAESIALGRPIDPVEMTAKPQKVLYIDFELTQKQFEMRYAAEHEPEEGAFLKDHYRFSERFKRIEVKHYSCSERGTESFEARLRRTIEPLMKKLGAKVLIVDNITYLKRTAESTRESAPLMKELNRLKKELGLSILVLAHTPKRDTRRPIRINDLQGSKVIANFADSIFAIGQSKAEPGVRFIKHIKSRSTELVFDEAHLPTFRIGRLKGNFLGFEFLKFSSEARHLRDTSDEREWQTIERIKKMADDNLSIRVIADELKLSKSTAHRLLKMWQPPENAPAVAPPMRYSNDLKPWPDDEDEDDLQRADNPFDGAEACAFDGCLGCDLCDGRPGNIYNVTNADPRDHKNCPDDCEMCGPRRYSPDDTSLDAELKERSDKFYAELEEWLDKGKHGSRPVYGNARNYENTAGEEDSDDRLEQDSTSAAIERKGDIVVRYTGPEQKPNIVRDKNHRMAGTKPSKDDFGRDIFIEEEFENGGPKIWYYLNPNGNITRWKSNGRVSKPDGVFDELPPIEAKSN